MSASGRPSVVAPGRHGSHDDLSMATAQLLQELAKPPGPTISVAPAVVTERRLDVAATRRRMLVAHRKMLDRQWRDPRGE